MTLYPRTPRSRRARSTPVAARGDEHARAWRPFQKSFGPRARARPARSTTSTGPARRARASPSPSPSRRSRRSTRRPSLFTPSVLEAPTRGRRSRKKALPIRATRSWACSNGGFLRAVRLRREAFSVADLFVASIARVRDGSRIWMSRGVGRRGAPRVGSDRDARGGRVPRARDRIRVRDARVRRYDRTQGAQSDENARDGPTSACGVAHTALPRARAAAPLGVVVLCAAGWGVAYGMKKLDPLIRFLAAFAPKPRGRRRP